MVLLPKEDREERAIGIFLEYYNQAYGTSYDINECEWLDRSPRIGQKPQGPIPDCLCIDAINGTEMVIERTMLTGEQAFKLTQGAEKLLAEVRDRLSRKLPGVFLLHDWGVNAIRFSARNREGKIAQLCQVILATAPMLVEGEEVTLSQPFPVKLRKQEACKVKTNCALVWVPLGGAYDSNKNSLDQQLRHVLNEANKKFTSYADKQTVLLINIWETGLQYEYFKSTLFKGLVMEEYSNIRHIYLSEGQPNPPIYHLWSKPQ